jgi:CheY-like chemotaxis protein
VDLPLESVRVEGSSNQPTAGSKLKKFTGIALVVDDDEISGEIAKLMLCELGMQVDLAKNGLIGLELAGSRRYDMILMDCWMPVMSGIEATMVLRSSAGALSKDVPVIALTANARTSDVVSCRAAGMNDFITKPLLMETLVEFLSRYLPAGPAGDVGKNNSYITGATVASAAVGFS